jgi:hypothetical protein
MGRGPAQVGAAAADGLIRPFQAVVAAWPPPTITSSPADHGIEAQLAI